MADIATVSAVLGSIKTASDLAKVIKDSSESLQKAEIKMQLADLINSLADARMELAELQSVIIDKDNEIFELNAQINVSKSVVWVKPYYFIEEDDHRDGPFCAQCYDTTRKLIRLQGGGTSAWHCQTCNNRVKDENYVSPKPIRVSGPW